MSRAIANVDAGGNLVGFLTPEGTRIPSVSLTINRAWRAIAMKRSSIQVQPIIQPDTIG